MSTKVLIRIGCVLALALALSGSVTGAVSAGPSGPTPSPAAAKPIHRVVWDAYADGGSGTHLRSARPDGTGLRKIYDSPNGFITQLTLDRAGRRVAFAPCCKDKFPKLVVVPVAGGKALRPLAHHRKIYAVGGIGWSADGSRLAFEGWTEVGGKPRSSLWTVRPNGSGLRKVVDLPRRGQPVINVALAWTRAGIVYSDGTNLRVASRGKTRLLMRAVRAVRISGDGSRLFLLRTINGRDSIWSSAPNGSGKRREFLAGDPGAEVAFSMVTPNYNGSQLLAVRWGPGGGTEGDQVVTWKLRDGEGSAVPLPFAKGDYTATWN